MMIEGFSALLLSQTNNYWTLILGGAAMNVSSALYHISGLSQISEFSEPMIRQIARGNVSDTVARLCDKPLVMVKASGRLRSWIKRWV